MVDGKGHSSPFFQVSHFLFNFRPFYTHGFLGSGQKTRNCDLFCVPFCDLFYQKQPIKQYQPDQLIDIINATASTKKKTYRVSLEAPRCRSAIG